MTLPPGTDSLIDRALAEDIGTGDWTTLWTVPAALHASARVVSKADGVAAGIAVACQVFRRFDGTLRVDPAAADGQSVRPQDVLLSVSGSARAILSAERVALNLLGHLSGVATQTQRYVNAVSGTGARILDTRKTTPGLRALEKAAVVAGGGNNHRFGLFDMVLIKENHIAAAGSIDAAVRAVRQQNHQGLRVEAETTTPEEVEQALAAGVNRILFDNMSVALLRESVDRVRKSPAPRPETEASGGVSLATVREVALTGVDFISVGVVTHSAAALDVSLLLSAGSS